MSEQSDQRLRNLRDLPQEFTPRRDLWPVIAAAIAAEPRNENAEPRNENAEPSAEIAQPRSARSRPARYGFAVAACVALLAVGAWLGRNTLQVPDISTTAAQRPSAPGIASGMTMAASFALDPASQAERQRRLNALAGQLQALPPETQLKVKASLAAIEKSVLDIQTALGRDPGNLLLQEMLVNTYQDEMRVLGVVDEANRIASEPGI